MSIDNICNLQCKMCSSYFSSKLVIRDQFLGLPVHKKLEPNFYKLNNVDISNLEWIKIIGGEPLITPNLEPFLDYLESRVNVSNVIMELITNGSVIPDEHILEKLRKYKKIELSVSLDSYNTSNDYQRFGSSYKDTFSNAVNLNKLLPNSELAFHSTVSILTANHLSETLNYITNKHGYHNSIDFVKDPEYLSVYNAPPKYIEWILEKNKDNHTAHRILQTAANNAKFSEKAWQDFINFTNKTDSFYKINIADYNLELFEFIKTLD